MNGDKKMRTNVAFWHLADIAFALLGKADIVTGSQNVR
jgi:hypothetical protein